MMQTIRKIDRETLGILGIVLAVVLFVAVNVLTSFGIGAQRIDVTSDRLFTLSDGTRQVLSKIDEPIVLRLYASHALSEANPAFGTYMKRVREFIENYVNLADGKLKLQIFDPAPYSPEEDAAVAYGLAGVPLTEAGDMGYFGLAATNSTDDQEVIKVFDAQREKYLEYDLTRMVYNLAHPKKLTIGLLSHLPIDSDPTRENKPWTIITQMEQFFTIKPLGRSMRRIPDNIDIVMIVHPRALPDAALYAVDQFMLRGGRAFVMVDPMSEEEQYIGAMMRQPPLPFGSDLKKLFDAWGIEYSPTKFVADRQAATQVEAPSGRRTVVVDYVAWLRMGAQYLNHDDVITGELQRITMADAGALKKKDGAAITFEPLIQSSISAMMVDTVKIAQNPDPVALLRQFKASGERYTMAARIGGTLKTAFPDGPPAPDEKPADADSEKKLMDELKAEHLNESKQPAQMVVVADADMLADRFWLQTRDMFGTQLAVPTANNAAFVINALDNLGGSNALIGLRSRGLSVRPFDRVREIQQAAETRYRQTEQDLMQRMKDTEAKLEQLGGQQGAKAATTAEGESILSDKQRATIEQFRADLLQIRRQLRDVQHSLRADIEELRRWLQILNILAVPAVVSVIAVALAWARRRRFRRRSTT